MPVPLPGAGEVLLVPPDFGEAQRTAQAIAAAIAPDTGLTDFQRVLLEALYVAMTGHRVQLNSTGPMTPLQIAESLRPRNLAFRTRGVQIMLLCALILRPLPPEVAERIAA